MNSVEQIFQQAAARHQEGRLQDAERLYRSILQTQPKHPEANHNLGMIAIQSKRPGAALPYFEAAIEANPNQGRFRLSYVYALLQAGRKDAARQEFARSLHLELDGDAVQALKGELSNYPGDQSNSREEASLATLFAEGRFAEVRTIAEKMTTRFPMHAKGWMALGVAFAQMGKTADAIAPFQRAAALEPKDGEAHFNLCLALRDLARLTEAEASCRRSLALKPDFVEGHGILGVILQNLGRHADAETSFRNALHIAPELAPAHRSLGDSLQALGRPAEAEAAFRRALELDPQDAVAHMNLGGALTALGRVEEAEASIRRALGIAPESAPAHLSHGTVLTTMGRPGEAEASFRRALQINPNHIEAHRKLGNALKEQGRAAEAQSSFQRALDLELDFAKAQNDAASDLIADGDPATALNLIVQSLGIRETDPARRNFVACVRRLKFSADDEVRAIVLRALTESWARPVDLASVAINFVKLNPAVKAGGADASALGADALLCALLNSTPVCDIDLERFLTLTRRALLEEAAAAQGAAGTSGPMLDFYGALANQCFINEYVFACGEDESRKAGELRDALRAALEAGKPASPLLVLAVAAYSPLGSLPLAPRLLDAQWPDAVTAVLVQQVREPEEERRLRSSIPRLTAIEDEISLRVQNQYEENPYPRWTKTTPVGKATDLAAFLRQKFPRTFSPRGDARDGSDILIAGCGTGQHSIETGQMYVGARVLAVDLSMRSLGYARRKTNEAGLDCIEYAQADLLRLGSLDRRFDLIESVGVLHHLADPWAGWRVLLSLLRPGGIMRLGFYSEQARRGYVKVRAFIAGRGYRSTTEDIRRFRQDLLRPEAAADLQSVASQPDFFSTSACRDLLFHVQEHRMSLSEIGAFLRANGLVLLGFDIEDEARHAYRQRFPLDRAAVDLDQWQRFEDDNPDTFVGMYQFWAQKAS